MTVPTQPTRKTRYCFGAFVLDIGTRTLLRDGTEVQLSIKEFETLQALVEAGGRAVEKDALVRRIWPDTFVGDASLARNISVLRKHLGPEAIRTLPKHGYRFDWPVAVISEPEPSGLEQSRHKGDAASHGPVSPNEDVALRAMEITAEGPETGSSKHVSFGPPAKARIKLLGMLLVGIVFLISAVPFMRFRTTPPHHVPKILVLPLEDTAENADEYLANGLTEQLITQLSRVAPHAIAVIGSLSSMQLKGTHGTTRQLGKEFAADYIVQWTLWRSEDNAKISVELVRVSDQVEVWSADYERRDDTLANLPHEIATSITKHLQISSSEIASIAPLTSDPKAYEDYLKGRYFWNKRLKEPVATAQQYFSKAIARDPRFAQAYAGLADCYIVLAGSHMSAEDAYARAREAADKAVFLDGSLPDPHVSLAYIEYAQDWNWTGSEQEFQRAIELDPQYALAHHWYSILLDGLKRHTAAVNEIKQALEIDPLSVTINANAGMALMLAGQNAEAERQLQKAIELDPANPMAYGYLGQLYVREHRYTEAIQALSQADKLETQKGTYTFGLIAAEAQAGRITQAKALESKLLSDSRDQFENPYGFVVMYSELGQTHAALSWLDRAVREHSVTALEMNNDEALDPLRSDTHFQALLRSMNLAQ